MVLLPAPDPDLETLPLVTRSRPHPLRNALIPPGMPEPLQTELPSRREEQDLGMRGWFWSWMLRTSLDNNWENTWSPHGLSLKRHIRNAWNSLPTQLSPSLAADQEGACLTCVRVSL